MGHCFCEKVFGRNTPNLHAGSACSAAPDRNCYTFIVEIRFFPNCLLQRGGQDAFIAGTQNMGNVLVSNGLHSKN